MKEEICQHQHKNVMVKIKINVFLGMDDYGDIFYGINFASADYLGLCTNE
jgi:hypothetical protein